MTHRIVAVAGFWVALFCCSPVLLRAVEPKKDETYETEKRLFHIERSKNRNIVCYDLNTDKTGVPDEKKPLSVYWINREEHPGQHGELSFVQEKLAFGYTVIENRNGIIFIELNAAKNRKVTIERKEDKYFCRMEINRQPAALRKIFVKTKANNSLQVEYVEVHGFTLATGASVVERFYP